MRTPERRDSRRVHAQKQKPEHASVTPIQDESELQAMRGCSKAVP